MRVEQAMSAPAVTVTAATPVKRAAEEMDCPEGWHTARVLAEQVPGVAGARVTARAESPAG